MLDSGFRVQDSEAAQAKPDRLRFCRVLMFVATCVAWFAPIAARAQATWEYSPYVIKVWLAYGPSAELTDGLANQIAQTVSQRAYTTAGATWSSTL